MTDHRNWSTNMYTIRGRAQFKFKKNKLTPVHFRPVFSCPVQPWSSHWDCVFDKITVAGNEWKSICPFVDCMRFPVPEHQTWTNTFGCFIDKCLIWSNTDLEKCFSNWIVYIDFAVCVPNGIICLNWLSNMRLNFGYGFETYPPPPSGRLVHILVNLY